MSVNKKVIKVEDLRVYFHTKKGDSKAVDGNHFTMYENESNCHVYFRLSK